MLSRRRRRRAREDLGLERPDRLLGRGGPDRQALSAQCPGAGGLRERTRHGRGERPLEAREPVRARHGQAARGLPADSHPVGRPLLLRDVLPLELHLRPRGADLPAIRAAHDRRAGPACADPASARVVARAAGAARPGRARAAAQARHRRVGRRAATDRTRPPRRSGPGSGRPCPTRWRPRPRGRPRRTTATCALPPPRPGTGSASSARCSSTSIRPSSTAPASRPLLATCSARPADAAWRPRSTSIRTSGSSPRPRRSSSASRRRRSGTRSSTRVPSR